MLKTLERLQVKMGELKSSGASAELVTEISELNAEIREFAESKNNTYLISLTDGVEKELNP